MAFGWSAAPAPAAGGWGHAPAPAPAAGWSPYTGGFTPMNPAAWALFTAVDVDRSGSISEKELQVALSNGGWTTFSPRTTRVLIRMFDADRSGTLGYPEFERLIGTLDSWRRIFEAADRDRSGRLSTAEVIGSIRTLGFSLPDEVLSTMASSYDDDASGQLSYDEFIRLLAELSALTAQFRRFDTRGDGTATMRYADFLSIVFSTKA